MFNFDKKDKSLVGTVLDMDLTKKLYTTISASNSTENNSTGIQDGYAKKYLPHDLDLTFAQNFIKKDGKFIYCINQEELISKLSSFLRLNDFNSVFVWEDDLFQFLKSNENCTIKLERNIDQSKLAISYCESLVADEGTIIINVNQNKFRPLDIFPEYQIILASKSQVKVDIDHAITDYMLKYESLFPFIIDISKEEKMNNRFAMNKPILPSRGTKNIIVFYCEECGFS